MRSRSRVTQFALFALVAGRLIAACAGATLEGSEITVNPNTTILIGQTATLKIDVIVKGATPVFEWKVERGRLSSTGTPSVIYTAPDKAGPDVVTVVVTAGDATLTQSITFDVVEPTQTPMPTTVPVTDTPAPSATPALTDTPIPTAQKPVECNHPSITSNVFPQLKDVDGRFPIYAGDDGIPRPKFLCQGVFDVVHSAPLAIRIEFRSDDNADGWWGIATPKGYDLTQLDVSEVCFWVYAEEQLQAFRLKLKGPRTVERGVDIEVVKVREWTQICTPLAKFSDQGVDLTRLDNVNLGFNKETKSATIWVDDFEFK